MSTQDDHPTNPDALVPDGTLIDDPLRENGDGNSTVASDEDDAAAAPTGDDPVDVADLP